MKLEQAIQVMKTAKGQMVPGRITRPDTDLKWCLAIDGSILTEYPDAKISNTSDMPDAELNTYCVEFI